MNNEDELNKEFEKKLADYVNSVNHGELDKAETEAMEMLFLAGQQSLTKPDPRLQLMHTASSCESAGDWEGALVARRKLLDLKNEPDNPAFMVKPLIDLSRLYRLLGQMDAAWEQAQAGHSFHPRDGGGDAGETRASLSKSGSIGGSRPLRRGSAIHPSRASFAKSVNAHPNGAVKNHRINR